MKIALYHDSVLPPKNYGGIERIVMTLAKEYTRLGHEVVIVCRKGSSISDFESVELAEGEALLEKYLPPSVEFLHSHQPLKEKPTVPFLVTIHGNGHSGERYFSNTNFLSLSHAKNHNAKYIVYNGVDTSQYPLVTQKEDYFVFLARTTWRVKNVKTAIDWANDLGVRLEIMGGRGLSRGKINYNGLVDEKQKIELLSKAKALIYPTNWDEPCAAAPLEAMACGTPVIASANGCMPELVSKETGVICHDYEELLASKKYVESLSPQACQNKVKVDFSLQRMAADYLKLIQKILEEGELDQTPRYNFQKSSVKLLFKPSLKNRVQFALTGKI